MDPELVERRHYHPDTCSRDSGRSGELTSEMAPYASLFPRASGASSPFFITHLLR